MTYSQLNGSFAHLKNYTQQTQKTQWIYGFTTLQTPNTTKQQIRFKTHRKPTLTLKPQNRPSIDPKLPQKTPKDIPHTTKLPTLQKHLKNITKPP